MKPLQLHLDVCLQNNQILDTIPTEQFFFFKKKVYM
jgi:hypothetical protein